MASISQSEGSSQPTEELCAGRLFQVKEQTHDSSNSNQEQPVTNSTPIQEQFIASSSPGKDLFTRTSLLKPQGSTFTTIAPELRLIVYKHLFQTPATYLLRRRAGIDDDEVIKRLTHTFDSSILFTCRAVYQEALPIFYASQTFHCSSTTGGLSKIKISNPEFPADSDTPVRDGAMPPFSDNLHLMVNLSMDLEVVSSGNTDAVLSKQITAFARHCPRLRTLIIHLLTGNGRIQDFPADSATASVLRQLRPRLDNLSILVLASRPHEDLPNLRLSIADNKYWSGKCWSGRCWSDQCWRSQPLLNVNPSTLQWPYLTLPSLIQGHVGRECSRTSNIASYSFVSPQLQDDYIYKWTCQKEVEEDVGVDSIPFSTLVGAREAAAMTGWVVEDPVDRQSDLIEEEIGAFYWHDLGLCA